MGGLFSTPSMPATTITTSTVDTSKDDSDDNEDTSTVTRNRKGLAQNINTSWRGVLEENTFNPTRKSLLGD